MKVCLESYLLINIMMNALILDLSSRALGRRRPGRVLLAAALGGAAQLWGQDGGQCAFLVRAAAPGEVRAAQAKAQKAGAFCENTLRVLAE